MWITLYVRKSIVSIIQTKLICRVVYTRYFDHKYYAISKNSKAGSVFPSENSIVKKFIEKSKK